MAEDTANKALIKALKDNRKETITTLDEIIADNKKIVDNTDSTKKAVKEAAKKQLKAAKARDTLQKQEITLRKDLKKNIADIGTTITGGIEGVMSEAFGPLGGIASSLTVGFFKRRQENKKNVESDQMQVDATDVLVEEMQEDGDKKKKKTEEDGGELDEGAAESAEETAGGVQEVGEGLGTTNQLLTDIEGHLNFMTENMEDAESRRERLRKQGGKVAPKKGKKKEDDEGFTFAGLMGTVLGAISGAIMGTIAGLSIGFLNMWKMIFKFIGGKLAKMFPNVTKMLSNVFGKGGKLSKFFLAIKAFFTENKAFKTISDGFTKFKTSIKSFGTSVMKFINPILKLFSGGSGGGALSGFSKFKGAFKTFFKVFKTFFSKIFLPLQVIISLFDGFFEAKDAAGKSEGMLATFFNSIIGFFGGILDGLIMGTLDLIKDGISWIAGFLGFEDVEKFLDSFSFSDMFNEFLDDIYKWFNLLFSDPVAALTNLFAGYFGAALSVGDFILDMIKKPFVWLMELFGWDDAAAATESFSLSGWVMGKWEAVKAWFTGIFSWAKKAGADGEGGWSIMTFIDTIWTKVKTWFTDLFAWGKKAGATEDGGWSLMSFIYGKDGVVNKVKQWFKDLFSFGGEGEKTNIVGAIIDSLKALPDKLIALFSRIVDSVTSLIPGFEAVTDASKYWDVTDVGKKQVDTAALTKQVASMDMDQLNQLATSFDKERKSTFGGLENEAEVRAILAARSAKLTESGGVVKGKARGAIVTKPAYLPSSGTVVGEHASWSGKGAARGAVDGPIPDGGAEAVIPLDGERGGRILAEALAPAIAGAILNELMMARVGGAEGGGGSPTVIQDNSTNQNVTNNTIVRTPSPSGPGLHFEGRDFVHKIA